MNTNMLNPTALTKVNRRQIESIAPSKVSVMPAGLLVTLDQDEILDLLAYLLSAGQRNHAILKR